MAILPNTKFLNIPMICASLIGIFPSEFLFQDNKVYQNFYSIYSNITFGCFATFVLTAYVELFVIMSQEEINFAELSKNLIITPLFTITIIRQNFIRTSGFKQLLKHILADEKYMDGIIDQEVADIRNKSAYNLSRGIKFYLGMMVVTEISYTIRPWFEPEQEIILENRTLFVKQTPLSTWFPFDKQEHFIVAYLFQVIYIIFGSCYDTYGEFIQIAVIAYPTSSLKVLQHVFTNFETYQQNLLRRYKFQNKDLAAFVTLRECIHFQESIIKYIEEFNRIMSTCMFLDFMQSSIHMAFVLAETLTQQVTLVQLVSVAAYLIVLNFRLLLYYYYANEVVLLSQGLSSALYQSKWYEQSQNVKFMALMIINRTQKPLKFKLGAFGDMSLSKFLSIINAAYSYVMLMCSIK